MDTNDVYKFPSKLIKSAAILKRYFLFELYSLILNMTIT